MKSRSIPFISFFLLAVFGGACIAQDAMNSPPVHAAALGDSVSTQKLRCKNLGSLVNRAAIARDNHDTEDHFMQKNTVSKDPSGNIGALIHKVFISDDSPAVWQKKVFDDCARKVKL